MPKPNSVGCHRQLNNSSLHNQTRRNPLGGDVLWIIMTWCHHYQISLRARHIPGCRNVMADLPSSPVSRMVNASTDVQTDLSKWFTPHVDLFATHLNHKVPLYVSPVPALNMGRVSLLMLTFPWLSFTRRSMSGNAIAGSLL